MDANFQEADLSCANLQEAFLMGANLQGAYMKEADLQGAYLSNTNLRGANLGEANLQGASLGGADLGGAENLTIEQISTVGTLFWVKNLDEEIMNQVLEEYPSLLKEPEEIEEGCSDLSFYEPEETGGD